MYGPIEGNGIHSRFLSFSTVVVFFFLMISCSLPTTVSSADTLTSSESLTPDQTLISSNDAFQLGFFSTPDGSSWFLGIWYKNIPDRTYVWVANRDRPINNSSAAVFKIGGGGNILVVDQNATPTTVWSSNRPTAAANPVAQLLDSGNLVLRESGDSNKERYLWQSFDYPGNTLLPGMKLGWDSTSGLNRYVRSWKSTTDPRMGDFTCRLDVHGLPEMYVEKNNGSEIVYRSGGWNGIRYSGVPEMKSTADIQFVFLHGQEEVSYSYYLNRPDFFSRVTINSSGTLERFTWVDDTNTWSRFWYAPKDQCDDYVECGAYGICDTNASPVCNCTLGFTPKNPTAWNLRSGKDGCIRLTSLDNRTDGFLQLSGMKLPQSGTSYVNRAMKLDECRDVCLKNHTCTAYSSANISAAAVAPGCVMWTTELLDMRHYETAGQDIYVKLAASDIAAYGHTRMKDDSSKSLGAAAIVGIAVAGGLLLLGLTAIIVHRRKTKLQSIDNVLVLRPKRPRAVRERSQDLLLNASPNRRDELFDPEEVELPLFDLNTIVLATNNFSNTSMLGQGGFGCVYKGIIEGGETIAVKRLSKSSGQGTEEFKNEVKLIAKLQHRNLVRLLGCCIEMDERMLVYEYMEHRGLDSILFSKTAGSSTLSWQKRFDIICGIARGLLYLHQDSRFKIIHRDLKASNILLDEDMNPKISDFGMARIFGRDQDQATTRRVVGTYGYMSPEYAMHGFFSVKSDVFSFGVLLLEIVSGKKNSGFYSTTNEQTLLGHVWTLWEEGKGLELVDRGMRDDYSVAEVVRCIQVGLLCVQEHAEDRPVMSTVVMMIGSETATMPRPKNPGFYLRRSVESGSSSSNQDVACTVNQVTMTEFVAR